MVPLDYSISVLSFGSAKCTEKLTISARGVRNILALNKHLSILLIFRNDWSIVPHFLWSFLHIAPDRIAKAMILQEMRPPLQTVCTIKKQKKTYKPTTLRWKKPDFLPLYFIYLYSFQLGLICWPQTWIYCQDVVKILRKYKSPQLRV